MMRILLVEDMDSDAELIRLELLGEWPSLQFDWANSRHTLALALKNPPADLALIDSRLPGLHGSETFQLIAGAWPGVPLVFCVGSPDLDPLLQEVVPRAAALVDKNRLETLVPTLRRLATSR
ncbi:response regulator [Solilutibacter silvestris]|uniref:Response regulator receiver domain-containing protein n=1 Tax=Solilutibacter silvestris TaxID=1645665 RepID=A0A2K1PY81_9GAMM|nr:response regulator [Lysobacter silvestris]PNS07755.1 Response regulator receiver domain-containing protein [Lysobacter silvestris]